MCVAETIKHTEKICQLVEVGLRKVGVHGVDKAESDREQQMYAVDAMPWWQDDVADLGENAAEENPTSGVYSSWAEAEQIRGVAPCLNYRLPWSLVLLPAMA